MRAQLSRAPSAHGRPNAERLRLVAGREHDSATDDHGSPTQARIVALLHRGEEGVEVGVQDRHAGHEHMFAHACPAEHTRLDL